MNNRLAIRYILVMRHAEKPEDPGNPNLSPEGYACANRLVTYIPETFGKPNVIIAAANSPESQRPVQTVTPLANQFGLTPQAPYTDHQFADAAQMMLKGTGYNDQPMIVCCWHHERIPDLMDALGCEEGSYPNPWDENVFNLILKVGIHAAGTIKVDRIWEPF